jgi:hypothetical protein
MGENPGLSVTKPKFRALGATKLATSRLRMLLQEDDSTAPPARRRWLKLPRIPWWVFSLARASGDRRGLERVVEGMVGLQGVNDLDEADPFLLGVRKTPNITVAFWSSFCKLLR